MLADAQNSLLPAADVAEGVGSAEPPAEQAVTQDMHAAINAVLKGEINYSLPEERTSNGTAERTFCCNQKGISGQSKSYLS